MTIKVKTGEIVPLSGQYIPAGGKIEFTFVAGKRVPPTSDGTTTFILVDKTKHSGDKK